MVMLLDGSGPLIRLFQAGKGLKKQAWCDCCRNCYWCRAQFMPACT